MLSAEMFYRGVIVPGGKVAHESLRLRCKFQWEHKCLLVLMVWFLYSSGEWLACFKCKRGMYFFKIQWEPQRDMFLLWVFGIELCARLACKLWYFFLFIEHLLMEPFVVRLVCFASPLFARSRSGRVELGRIRYSDPVLVLSESDEVP